MPVKINVWRDCRGNEAKRSGIAKNEELKCPGHHRKLQDHVVVLKEVKKRRPGKAEHETRACISTHVKVTRESKQCDSNTEHRRGRNRKLGRQKYRKPTDLKCLRSGKKSGYRGETGNDVAPLQSSGPPMRTNKARY